MCFCLYDFSILAFTEDDGNRFLKYYKILFSVWFRVFEYCLLII